jgi:hypothetical protein
VDTVSDTDTFPAVVGPAKKRGFAMPAVNGIDLNKLLMWAANALGLALVSLALWLGKNIIDQIDAIDQRTKAVELWQAEVRGNRFTASDGAKVWEAMSKLQATFNANEPAVKDAIARIEAKVDKIDERQRAMEARIKP